MAKFSRSVGLLTLLATLGLQIAPLQMLPVTAQPVTNCPAPIDSLLNDLTQRSETAHQAIKNRDGATALRILQESQALALQARPASNAQSFLLDTWLSPNSDPTSRFEQLIKITDSSQISQLRSRLDQFFQLAQQVTKSNSELKVRSLAAIARHAVILGQPKLASRALIQAQEAARFVQGAHFQGEALLDIAAGYITLSQVQNAQPILAQIERNLPQVPDSERSSQTYRLAVLYAKAGNEPKARAIAAKLPEEFGARAGALLAVTQVHIAAQRFDQAEKLIPTISRSAERAIALAQLAAAYANAKQPAKATQRFRQAVQLGKSQTDQYLRNSTLREVALSYIQAGRREEARQLAQTDLKDSQPEIFTLLIRADVQAKQPEKAQQLLSQLIQRARTASGWERFELNNIIQLAIETQQFNWILKEWNQIAKVDGGLFDSDVERLVRISAQTGQPEKVLKWVEQLPIANRPVLQLKLRAEVARQAHRSGQTVWARNLLQRTQRLVPTLVTAAQEKLKREGGDVQEPADIQYTGVSAIALVYAQMGDTETTRQLLTQVLRFNAEMGDTGIGGRVDHPFAMFMEASQAIGALQIAQGTQNPDGRLMRLQQVSGLLLDQNRFDLVMPIVAQIPAASPKTQLLLAIARRYTALQQPEKALPMLAQAFKVAQTIPGEESEFDRLGAEGGTVIPIETDRGSMIEAIALEYARLKRSADALRVANALKDQQTREEAIQKVKCELRAIAS
jgi:tetratricopeptide (TPR) repeat protein